MMEADVAPGLERLLRPQRIAVDLDEFSPAVAASMGALLRLFGAQSSSAARESAGARLITFDQLRAMGRSNTTAIGAAASERPLLVCPATNVPVALDDGVLACLADITGAELGGS